MPRGKNYVNNNKGMTMQASNKKKSPSMEQCFYGKGCTRTDCIYRHDGPAQSGSEKSNEPCMPFLAGLCAFSAKGCRKRHPNKEEAEKLIAKYKATKCRYGEHCKTAGCLYIHPTDGADLGGPAAFPPLVGTNGAPRPVAPSGAWKPMQPTGAAVVSPPAQPSRAAAATINGQQPPAADAPVKAAWGSSQPAPVWGKPKNAVLMSHAGSPANGGTVPSPAAAVTPSNGNSPVPKPPMSFAAVAQKQPQPQAPTPQQQSKPPTQPVVESTSLNIHAKEFVPGGGF